MKKIFFFLILQIFIFSLSPQTIYGCQCKPPSTDKLSVQVQNAYQKYTAVFSGKVIQIEQKHINSFKKVTFEVGKSWKSNLENEVFVTTADNGASCGYNFKVGDKYLVYAYVNQEINALFTSGCTRTSPLKFNKDVQALNKIEKSRVKSSLK